MRFLNCKKLQKENGFISSLTIIFVPNNHWPSFYNDYQSIQFSSVAQASLSITNSWDLLNLLLSTMTIKIPGKFYCFLDIFRHVKFNQVLFKTSIMYPVQNFSPSPIQFSSVTQSRLTLCDPMDCNTPGLPVHHQVPELVVKIWGSFSIYETITINHTS